MRKAFCPVPRRSIPRNLSNEFEDFAAAFARLALLQSAKEESGSALVLLFGATQVVIAPKIP